MQPALFPEFVSPHDCDGLKRLELIVHNDDPVYSPSKSPQLLPKLPSGTQFHTPPSTASPSSSIGKLSSTVEPTTSVPAQNSPSDTARSSWTDFAFLFMSVAFGCLSLMSLRNPFAELVGLVLGKSDLQSFLCLLVFFIVSVLIAYLTNPSENSFRAYLTEQSFRHHLTQLDDNLNDQGALNTRYSNIYPSGAARIPNHRSNDPNGPFHFANRASISLRTPKHVFHSFAIFTIAAMVPVAKSSQPDERESWSISDSWYIGAFGKWWRGGVWETWYQDVIARSKDEESWNSGILSIKNPDMLPEFHGPSLAPKTLPYLPLKPSPPKLRNRDRVPPKSSRNSSPPPLSKSASLPLHAKRVPVPLNDRTSDAAPPALPCPPILPIATDSIARRGSLPSSRSSLFEQSPLIAEVLRQISASQSSVQELRTQLADVQVSAAQSNEILQHELDSCRERKRQEDASRLELKTRTKTLDDSKRSAESVKRDAERKLKAAQTTRDNNQRRIDFLDKETTALHDRIAQDQAVLVEKSSDVLQLDQELTEALELKKKEIKATEDLLASLNRHSRELEDKLSSERDRLQALKQRSELRRQELVQQDNLAMNTDSLYNHSPTYDNRTQLTTTSQLSPFANPFLSQSSDLQHNGIDSLQDHHAYYGKQVPAPLINGNHTAVNDSSRGSFSSGEDDSAEPYGSNGYSFNLDSGNVVEGDARAYQPVRRYGNNPLGDGSPHATRAPGLKDGKNGGLRDYLPYDGLAAVVVSSGASWPPPAHTHSTDELGYFIDGKDYHQIGQSLPATKGQVQKKLNPDAKAFSLGPRSVVNPLPFDALNPTGLGLSVANSTSTRSSSLLRAFAPSPAEREALQRALGGSTNSSFERLPSLSDVGSIPSSPTLLHNNSNSNNTVPQQQQQHTSRDLVKVLQMPSWFPTFLPRKSKFNFKPWDDDEDVQQQQQQQPASTKAIMGQ